MQESQPPLPNIPPAEKHAPIEDEWYDKVKKTLEQNVTKETNTVPGKKEKEKRGAVEKIMTSVDDMIGDIVLANEMAKVKFDGDSALMHAARGGTTALIGLGLGTAFDNVLSKSADRGVMFLSRLQLPIDQDLANRLKTLEQDHPRIRYFAESASKNLMVGLGYNTIAYFSRPMLPSIEPKHLISSLVISGVDAAGPKGIEHIVTHPKVTDPRDQERMAKLWEQQIADKKTAIEKMPKTAEAAASLARQEMIEELERTERRIRNDWEDAFEEGKLTYEQIKEKLPPILTSSDIDKRKQEFAAAASAKGEAAMSRRKALIKELKQLQKTLVGIKAPVEQIEEPDTSASQLKHTIQNFVRSANPAVLLGMNWMIESVLTVRENTAQIRDIRKSKGGLPGQKVYIPQKENRREYGNKPSYNKDKVYYGKSDWNKLNKQQEEEERGKLM